MAKKTREESEEFFLLKKVAIRLFGSTADKHSNLFLSLKYALKNADAKVLFRTYLSLNFFLSFLVFILGVIISGIIFYFLPFETISFILGVILLPLIYSFLTFLLIYIYPTSVATRRKNDIETNLPFSLIHMAAIASSGTPPRTIFKILSQFKEYGEISNEAEKIDRNINFFGLDEIKALKEVIAKTPSPAFRDVLQGILITIQTGGNLKTYLKEEAEKAMFEYNLKRSRYTQTLSVYADFYTALLIAAPLVFITILSVLNIVGGTIFGIPIQDLINIGIFLMVFLNILFIAFIQFTQPRL